MPTTLTRKLSEEEFSQHKAKKTLMKLTVDFSEEIGSNTISRSEFIDFIQKKSITFKNSVMGEFLEHAYTVLSSSKIADPSEIVKPILSSCMGDCGGCGCDNVKLCHVIAYGIYPNCTDGFCGICH